MSESLPNERMGELELLPNADDREICERRIFRR